MSEKVLVCRLCNSPVVRERENYEVFEKMHRLCFHIVFEHDGDTDEPCDMPGCLWSRLRAYEDKLRELSLDPSEVYWKWEGI